MSSSTPLFDTIEADDPEYEQRTSATGHINAPSTQAPSNARPPPQLATNPGDAESGIAGILRQSAHPAVLFFLYFFRAVAITVYILSGLFISNYVLSSVIVVVLLAMDFWNCRNVAGRRLVGLRYWNQVASKSTMMARVIGCSKVVTHLDQRTQSTRGCSGSRSTPSRSSGSPSLSSRSSNSISPSCPSSSSRSFSTSRTPSASHTPTAMPSRSGPTTSRPQAGAWAWEASAARYSPAWSRTASDACSADSDDNGHMATSDEVQLLALDLNLGRDVASRSQPQYRSLVVIYTIACSLDQAGEAQCELQLLLFHCFSSALRSGIGEAEYMRMLYVTRRTAKKGMQMLRGKDECDELDRSGGLDNTMQTVEMQRCGKLQCDARSKSIYMN